VAAYHEPGLRADSLSATTSTFSPTGQPHDQLCAVSPGAGRGLDALIGTPTMEQCEIKLDPTSGTLDLDGLRRREFTEL
jgi:hypothetical protein